MVRVKLLRFHFRRGAGENHVHGHRVAHRTDQHSRFGYRALKIRLIADVDAHRGRTIDYDRDIAFRPRQSAKLQIAFSRGQKRGDQQHGRAGRPQPIPPSSFFPKRGPDAQRDGTQQQQRQNQEPRRRGSFRHDRPRDGQYDQRYQQAAHRQQHHFLQQDSPSSVDQRAEQELHGPPVEILRAATIQDVQNNRHQDSQQPEQHREMDKSHGSRTAWLSGLSPVNHFYCRLSNILLGTSGVSSSSLPVVSRRR